jgi:hypothetical protein
VSIEDRKAMRIEPLVDLLWMRRWPTKPIKNAAAMRASAMNTPALTRSRLREACLNFTTLSILRVREFAYFGQ